MGGGGSGAGAWEFVEKKEVTASAITSFDFATTLTGDTDGGYLLIGYIQEGSSAATTFSLRINGASAVARWIIKDESTQSTSAELVYCIADGDGCFQVRFIKTAKDKGSRFVMGRYVREYSSTVIKRIDYDMQLTTPADSVAITSLGVEGSNANSIGVNSVFYLYKLVTS